MTVDIFCCTYHRDARWLEYMLRSVQKYARGFRQTVVVYPTKDAAVLDPICARFPFVKVCHFEEAADGHAHQNAIKTSCDEYSDAEYFFHMDSDCVFTSEARPEDYMTDGKCDILFSPYSALNKVPGGVPWQGITSAALGIPVQIETMRRFPFLYPSWLYRSVRNRIEALHKKPFVRYALEAPNIGAAFHGYSEFNALGCEAAYFHKDKFHLYDVNTSVKPGKVKQYWSHSGLTEPEERELQGITGGWNET
jgi:hypothetical protein